MATNDLGKCVFDLVERIGKNIGVITWKAVSPSWIGCKISKRDVRVFFILRIRSSQTNNSEAGKRSPRARTPLTSVLQIILLIAESHIVDPIWSKRVCPAHSSVVAPKGLSAN